MSGRHILAGGMTLAFVPLILLLLVPDNVPVLFLSSSLYGFFLAPLYPAVSLPCVRACAVHA